MTTPFYTHQNSFCFSAFKKLDETSDRSIEKEKKEVFSLSLSLCRSTCSSTLRVSLPNDDADDDHNYDKLQNKTSMDRRNFFSGCPTTTTTTQQKVALTKRRRQRRWWLSTFRPRPWRSLAFDIVVELQLLLLLLFLNVFLFMEQERASDRTMSSSFFKKLATASDGQKLSFLSSSKLS